MRFAAGKEPFCSRVHGVLKGALQKDVCIYGDAPEVMFEDLCSCFHVIEAAGGLVSNADNRFLFIKRFGKWDLPKGKMEAGESSQDTALREVEEETGVGGLSILKPLPPTYHIYPDRGEWILKKTYWYRMHTGYRGKLSPQLKEDISEAAWLDPLQGAKALSRSYRSLNEVLAPYLKENS